MSNLAVEEAQAVVFVSNRAGAALRRRERCLKLAGIPHGVEAERRPSGTYYKLCVRENDAVAAHLALQMGGCGRTVKLQDPRPSLIDTLREIARAALEELTLLVAKLVDAIRGIAPLLLAGPKDSAGTPKQ
ncbi:MAG TPA: hypothetical protein VNO26_01635 [Candidatus Limnocylindria bacterium]|nr:hypothetical protein [Candidatus Limnocylindria bacterium]